MTYRSQLPPKLEEIRAQERKRRGITESGDYGHADAVDGSQSTIQCTIHRCTNLLVRDDMQCEPYVVLKKGPLWEARTATRNSRNAVWEEQFTVPLASQYPLEINVFDVKTIAGSSSFIGGYVFEPEEMSKYPTGRPFSIKLLPHRYETNAAFRLLDDLGEITISWDYHSTKQSVGKNSTSNYSNTASSSSNSIDHSISNSTNDNGNHVTKSVTENGLQSQPVTIILSFYYATGLPAHTQSEYFLRVLTQEIEGVTTPVPATHSIAEWQQELKVYTPNLHVPIPLYLVRADPLTNGVALGGAMLDVQHMPAEGEAQIPISSSVSDNIFPNKTAQDPWAHVMLGWHIQANELVSNSTEVIPHNSLVTPQQSVSRSSEVGDASERSYRLTIHVQSGVEFVYPSCAIMIRHNGFEGRTLSQAGHNPTYDQEVVFPSCETQLPVEVFLVDGNTSTVYGCGAFMFSSYHKGQKEEVICYAGSGPPSVHTMNPRVAQSTVGRIALTWRCQDPKSVPSPLNHSEEKNRTDNMPKQDQRPSIMQQQRALVTRGAAAHSPLIETNMAPDSQRSRQVQSQQHYPLRSKTLGARPKISASRQPFVSNASSARRKLLPSSENHEAKQSPRVIATVQGKRGMTPQIQSNTTPFRTPIPPRYSVESHISQTSEQQYTTEHGLPNSTLMIPSNSRTQVEHFSRSSTGSMTSKATAPGEQNQMLSATSIAKSRDLSPGGANLRIRAADRQVHSSIRKLSMQDGMTPLKIIGSNGVHTAVPPSVNTAFFRAGPPRPGDMKTRGDVNEAQTQRAVMPVRGGTPSSATYIRSRSAPWANSARGLKPSTPGGTNKFRSRSGITHDVISTTSKYGHHASESYTSDPSAASLSSRGGQIPMRSRPRQLHTGLNVLPARTPVKDTRLITTTSSRPNNRTPIIALSQTTRSHPDGLDETPLFIRPHTGKTVHTNTSLRIRSLNSSTHRQRTGRPGIMRSISAPKAASPQHSLSYMTAKETYNTAPQGSSRTLQAKGKSSILTQGVTGKTSANRSRSEPVKAGKRSLASSLRGNNQRSLNTVKIKSPNKTDMVDASPLSNTSELKKEIPLQEAHKPLSVDVSEAVHSTQEQTSLYTSYVVDEHNNPTTGLKSLDSYLKRNNTGDQTEVKRGDVTSSQSFHTEVSMHKIKFLENDYA